MSSTKELKHRVRSISSTKQITKAMELVAASKLRRVQEAARASQVYSQVAYSILHRIADSAEVQAHPYFRVAPKISKKLYIVFSSDRGLAGAFNANLQSKTIKAIEEDRKNGISADVVVFGRRGARFFAKISDVTLRAVYEQLEDAPDPEVFAPVFSLIDESIKSGECQAVDIVYTAFKTTLSQEVRLLNILPIKSPETTPEDKTAKLVFDLEPSAEVVMEAAAKLYLQSQIMQAKIDSSASEYAMRMLAMSNASTNAGDLIDLLTLELNATRQADITQQIAEISGGVAALADQ